MAEKSFTLEEEFDWSLHMLQLPLSSSSQLSSAYNISQRRYVAAKREPGGMGLHQDVTLWRQYCAALDGQGPEESNHAALIMPAIKHLHSENSKWKCHLTGGKLKGLIQSCKASTVDRSSSTPSPAELNNLLSILKKERPSKHSQAKEEMDKSTIPPTTLGGQSHPFTTDEPSLPETDNPLHSDNFYSKNDGKISTIGQNQYTFSRMIPPSDTCKQNNSNKYPGTGRPSEASGQRNFYLEQDQLVHRGNEAAQNTSDPSFLDHMFPHCEGDQRQQNSNIHPNQNQSSYFNNGKRVSLPANNPAMRDSCEYQMQNGTTRDFQGQYRGRGFSAVPLAGPAVGRGAGGVRSAERRYPWQRGRGAAATVPAAAAPSATGSFRTASHQLALNQARQRTSNPSRNSFINTSNDGGGQQQQCGGVRPEQYGSGRSLGVRPSSSVSAKFVPPVRRDETAGPSNSAGDVQPPDAEAGPYAELLADPRMKNIEAKMVELIMNEVLDSGLDVGWDDIAGLQQAKDTIQEVVVWPMLRPDIFTGLRGPPKGVLLFGPPGTGKTMIGKAIASQSGATFFSISASCLTSKWVGEGEKMVRALFAVARVQAPSVIFIDEIDSLLCQRSETEHESSRRIKTEFLVQLDGVGAVRERVLVVGATNRPQELDEAARRRLQKRLYIPLPEEQARLQLVSKLLSGQQHTLTPADMSWVAAQTDGYSGADVAAVCGEAAMGPIRSISAAEMRHIALHQVRAISVDDFRASVRSVRPSVCSGDLQHYCDWNRQYGIAAALGTTK